MADILGGGAGLFQGLSRGLQLILALRQVEENQRIERERNELMNKQDVREQTAFDTAQAEAPYEDIQEQLNKQNIVAAKPDIRREYTPPTVGDTFQPRNKFAPPAFGSSGLGPKPSTAATLDPSLSVPGTPAYRERTTDGLSRDAPSVGSIDTSHVAQVLERARREGMHQRKMGTLTDILTAASKQAQGTQLPVSGAFGPTETVDGKQVRAELPAGFTAMPERTFTPYQAAGGSGRSDPLDNIFGPLLNDPLKQRMLQKTDPYTYKQFEAWKARRIGVGPVGGAGADPDDPQPGETAQAYADRVGPRLGGEEAERRWLRSLNAAR